MRRRTAGQSENDLRRRGRLVGRDRVKGVLLVCVSREKWYSVFRTLLLSVILPQPQFSSL